MGFAIYQHELATGIRVSPHPESPSHLPPHSIPLGCPRAPALGALLHASNMLWSSILHMVMYMFQCYSLKSFHPSILPLSPKVCCPNIHQELFSFILFPEYRSSRRCPQSSLLTLAFIFFCDATSPIE